MLLFCVPVLAHEKVKVSIVVFHAFPSNLRLVSFILLVTLLILKRAGMTTTSNRGRKVKNLKCALLQVCECLVGTRGFGLPWFVKVKVGRSVTNEKRLSPNTWEPLLTCLKYGRWQKHFYSFR